MREQLISALKLGPLSRMGRGSEATAQIAVAAETDGSL